MDPRVKKIAAALRAKNPSMTEELAYRYAANMVKPAEPYGQAPSVAPQTPAEPVPSTGAKDLASALMRRDLGLRPEDAHQLAVNMLTPKPPTGSAAASWHSDAKNWSAPGVSDRLYPQQQSPALAQLTNEAIVGTDVRNAAAGVLDQAGSEAFSRGLGAGQATVRNEEYNKSPSVSWVKRQRVSRYRDLMAMSAAGHEISDDERSWLDAVNRSMK